MIVAVVRAKGSRVLEAHPRPKIPKVPLPPLGDNLCLTWCDCNGFKAKAFLKQCNY